MLPSCFKAYIHTCIVNIYLRQPLRGVRPLRAVASGNPPGTLRGVAAYHTSFIGVCMTAGVFLSAILASKSRSTRAHISKDQHSHALARFPIP